MGFKAAALALIGTVLMAVAGFAFLNFLIECVLSIVSIFS